MHMQIDLGHKVPEDQPIPYWSADEAAQFEQERQERVTRLHLAELATEGTCKSP